VRFVGTQQVPNVKKISKYTGRTLDLSIHSRICEINEGKESVCVSFYLNKKK